MPAIFVRGITIDYEKEDRKFWVGVVRAASMVIGQGFFNEFFLVFLSMNFLVSRRRLAGEEKM